MQLALDPNVSTERSLHSTASHSLGEKMEGRKRKLAEELLNDPPVLKASRVTKISEACLSQSSQAVGAELPWTEKSKKWAISAIESRTALNSIATMFFSGMALSVAAAVVDLKLNPAACSLPKAPLALSLASAVLTLIAGGMEILGSNIKHESAQLVHDDEVVKKFIDALESRRAEAKKAASGQVDDLHDKIKECIQDFDRLPAELKNELPPPELWTLWLLNTLPEEHPLRASSELLKNSAGLSANEERQAGITDLVEELIAGSTVFAVAKQPSENKQTSIKDSVVIDVGGDQQLEANKRKLTADLKEDPSRLKTGRIQAQADRLRVLQAKQEHLKAKQQNNFCVKLLKSKTRRLTEKVLIASSILLSSGATITDLIINDTNICARSMAAVGLNAASIGLLSVVSLIWMGYHGLKRSVAEKKHDEALVDRFVKAVEEHAQAAKNMQPDQVEALQEKIRECLKLFDELPDDLKEELPPRDIWILGLLNALPASHPIRPALLEMRSMSENLRARKLSHRTNVSSIASEPLQEQFERLFEMVEGIVGGPVHFLATGDMCVTREFQIQTLDEVMNNERKRQSSQISIGITI